MIPWRPAHWRSSSVNPPSGPLKSASDVGGVCCCRVRRACARGVASVPSHRSSAGSDESHWAQASANGIAGVRRGSLPRRDCSAASRMIRRQRVSLRSSGAMSILRAQIVGTNVARSEFDPFLQRPLETFGSDERQVDRQIDARFAASCFTRLDCTVHRAAPINGFQRYRILPPLAIEQDNPIAATEPQHIRQLMPQFGIEQARLPAVERGRIDEKTVGVAAKRITLTAGHMTACDEPAPPSRLPDTV